MVKALRLVGGLFVSRHAGANFSVSDSINPEHICGLNSKIWDFDAE
jgi:hypothetical protein